MEQLVGSHPISSRLYPPSFLFSFFSTSAPPNPAMGLGRDVSSPTGARGGAASADAFLKMYFELGNCGW